MNRDQIEHDEPDIDEVLTAYLDDELAEDEREAVETRLRTDTEFRTRLGRLQRAWDLLDTLPKTESPHDFTKSTVEMVATKITEDTETKPAAANWGLLLGIAGILLSAIAGYFIVYAALDSPNKQLMTDLPMLERLDEYRYAENIEFLEMLDEAGLFEEEATDE